MELTAKIFNFPGRYVAFNGIRLLFRHFTAKHFLRSSWMQKTFDRASKELSNDVQLNQIRLTIRQLLAICGKVHSWKARTDVKRWLDATGKNGRRFIHKTTGWG